VQYVADRVSALLATILWPDSDRRSRRHTAHGLARDTYIVPANGSEQVTHCTDSRRVKKKKNKREATGQFLLGVRGKHELRA
jgi:hypothetical protein